MGSRTIILRWDVGHKLSVSEGVVLDAAAPLSHNVIFVPYTERCIHRRPQACIHAVCLADHLMMLHSL